MELLDNRMRGIALGLISIVLLLGVTACGKGEMVTPKTAEKERKEARGKLTGEGLVLGGSSEEGSGGSSPLGVNSFLWRATLDTLSFMPIASADPFGGVIITDWYENPNAPGERFKVNALILDRSLRADGVRISLFKQIQDKGQWKDVQVDGKLAHDLEDTILTRARQMRVAQSTK